MSVQMSKVSRAGLGSGYVALIVLSISHAATPVVRRIQRVLAITIVWMSVEAALSLFAALLTFGGDSAIELASAMCSMHLTGS